MGSRSKGPRIVEGAWLIYVKMPRERDTAIDFLGAMSFRKIRNQPPTPKRWRTCGNRRKVT